MDRKKYKLFDFIRPKDRKIPIFWLNNHKIPIFLTLFDLKTEKKYKLFDLIDQKTEKYQFFYSITLKLRIEIYIFLVASLLAWWSILLLLK